MMMMLTTKMMTRMMTMTRAMIMRSGLVNVKDRPLLTDVGVYLYIRSSKLQL